jgi:membrane-bound metal-dependent hydrolase YbcI (DUF457 family)
MPDAPDRRSTLFQLGALVVAANAADFDFIPGILAGDPGRFHRGASHSFVAICAFTALALLVGRWIDRRSAVRFGLVLGLAFTGHLLLDMMSSWMDPHSGVAIAWPLSSYRLLSPFPIFIGISLAPGTHTFLEGVLHRQNFEAMAWELVVAGVIWGAVRLIRPARKRGAARGR